MHLCIKGIKPFMRIAYHNKLLIKTKQKFNSLHRHANAPCHLSVVVKYRPLRISKTYFIIHQISN